MVLKLLERTAYLSDYGRSSAQSVQVGAVAGLVEKGPMVNLVPQIGKSSLDAAVTQSRFSPVPSHFQAISLRRHASRVHGDDGHPNHTDTCACTVTQRCG